MSLNDIKIYSDGTFGPPGAVRHAVAAGSTTTIRSGELVVKTLGSAFVTVVTTNSTTFPSVGTNYIAGIAAGDSTQTASAAGYVDVIPNVPGLTYLCAPNVAATWDTQTEYDALVGDRVKFNVSTAGLTTVLALDNANNGCVVEPLDIQRYPGLVRFSLRQALNYTN